MGCSLGPPVSLQVGVGSDRRHQAGLLTAYHIQLGAILRRAARANIGVCAAPVLHQDPESPTGRGGGGAEPGAL